jgi:hypothetical protein
MKIVCDCNDTRNATDGVYFSLVYSKTFISLYTESREFNETTVSCKVETSVRHCSLNKQFYVWFVSFSVASIMLLAFLGVFLKYNPIDSLSLSSPNLRMGVFVKQWLCDSGLVSFCSWIENKPVILSNDEYFVISPRASVPPEQVIELGYETLPTSMSSNKVGYSYSIWREGGLSYFRLDFKNEKGFHKINCGMREHLMLSFCVLKISEGVPVTRGGERHIPSFKEIIAMVIEEDSVFTSSVSRRNDCFYGENVESLTNLVGKRFREVERQKIKELVIHNILFFNRFDFELILKGVFCLIKKPESCKNSEWKMYLSDVQNHILEGKSIYKKIIKKHQKSKALSNLNEREEEAEAMTSEVQSKSWLKAVLLSCKDVEDEEGKEKSKTKSKNKDKNIVEKKKNKPTEDAMMENREYKVSIDRVESNCIVTNKLAFMRPEWDDVLGENKKESKALSTSEDRVIDSMERSKCIHMGPALDFKEDDGNYDSDGGVPKFNPDEIPNAGLKCDNHLCLMKNKCPKFRVYRTVLDKLKELKENSTFLKDMTLKVGYCDNILAKKVKRNVIIKELKKTALVESGKVKKIERIEGLGPIEEMNAFNRISLKRAIRNGLQIQIPKGVEKDKKEKDEKKKAAKTDEEVKHNISGIVKFFKKEIEKFDKTKPLALFQGKPLIGRNKLMNLSFKAKSVKLMEIAMTNHKEALSNFMDGTFGKGFSVNKKVFLELETKERYSFRDIGVKKYVRTKIFRSKKKKEMVEKTTLAERLNAAQMEKPAPMTRSEREREMEERIRRSKTPRSCVNKLNMNFLDMQKICGVTKTSEAIKMKDLLGEINKNIDERNADLEELIEKCKGIEEKIRCFLA